MKVGDRVAYGVGVFLIICGIVIGFIWPLIFDLTSKRKLELNPLSETYKLWVKTPIPMYLEIYLFNWTNSEEFLRNKELKPEFKEIGPFVFKEVHQRVNITWNENDTVSYNQTRTWYFVPEESLDLSTPIFNLNVILTTATRMASQYNELMKLLLQFLEYYYKEELIIHKPAREWLFDGIKDKLLDLLKIYVDIPYDKFGWFYGRNLSSAFDGTFNIDTGANSIFSLGALKEWNHVNKTKFYDGECGVVRGSSGELFSPLKSWQDNLTIFVTDFCGPITLKYSGSESVEGLDGLLYVGDQSVFDNGTSNSCFCAGKCSPSGVRNVTSCRQAPLFISFPHFYLADSFYTKSVVGMHPNKSLHEFYLSIDPLTGLPLEVSAQLQLNVLLQPFPQFSTFKNVPNIYVPMMWFKQRAKVTSELASRSKTLRIFKEMGLWLASSLSLLGLLIIIIRICVVKYSSSKNFELLITSEEIKEDNLHINNSENER